MIRYTITILLCILAGGTVQAQADTSLHARLERFLELTANMNIEKTLDYTYPPVFSLVSRSDMADIMKKNMEDESMRIRMDSVMLDSIFPRFTFNKGEYAVIRYRMNVHMMLKDSVDEKGELINMADLQKIYELTFGAGKVSVNSKTREIRIKLTEDMLAIKDPSSPDWTFVNLDDSNPLATMVLGEDLIKELEKYK